MKRTPDQSQSQWRGLAVQFDNEQSAQRNCNTDRIESTTTTTTLLTLIGSDANVRNLGFTVYPYFSALICGVAHNRISEARR